MIEFLLALSFQETPDEHWNAKCGGSQSDINACYAEALDRSEARLETYLAKAQQNIERTSNDTGIGRFGLHASQQAFEAYRDIQCRSVYDANLVASARVMLSLACDVRLTDQRAHAVWDIYLRPMQGDPLLPEPGETVIDDLRSPTIPTE